MTPRKALLQRQVIALRSVPGFETLFRAWYLLAQLALVAFVRLREGKSVRALYLRRGGGRGELVPAASDLDFFLVLETMAAEQEMEFLKRFWRAYHRLRRPFPFLGEVLMGDENELRNWLAVPSVRAYESAFSWRRLAGRHELLPGEIPDNRDLFAEAVKCYADLLQVVLKVRPEQFRAGLRAHDAGAIHFRNGAKAALDLFRLHATFRGAMMWRLSREELTERLVGYGPSLSRLIPALRLRGVLFTEDPFPLFAELTRRALLCLDEMAAALEKEPEGERTFTVRAAASSPVDPYSLSVRELFAERILHRHAGLVSKAVLSEPSTGMYFTLGRPPSPPEMEELLRDLRDVNFSFERFSAAIPLGAAAYRQLAGISLLDSPFHAAGRYRAIELSGDSFTSMAEQPAALRLSATVLRKAFAELSFALRLEPRELPHFLDKMLGVVLSLRLAGEDGSVSGGTADLLARYGERYPERLAQIRAKLGAFLPDPHEEELWAELEQILEGKPGAENLRAQLRNLRALNRARPLSATLPSDAWINLTPLLRMEMNALKDSYFTEKPALRL